MALDKEKVRKAKVKLEKAAHKKIAMDEVETQKKSNADKELIAIMMMIEK